MKGKQGRKETEMGQEEPRLFLQPTQAPKPKLCRESSSQYAHEKLPNTLTDTFVQASTLESFVVDSKIHLAGILPYVLPGLTRLTRYPNR